MDRRPATKALSDVATGRLPRPPRSPKDPKLAAAGVVLFALLLVGSELHYRLVLAPPAVASARRTLAAAGLSPSGLQASWFPGCPRGEVRVLWHAPRMYGHVCVGPLANRLQISHRE